MVEPTISTIPRSYQTLSTVPLTFWSVAVILIICILIILFIFLFLSDFCCEFQQCQADKKTHHIMNHRTSIISGRALTPSAPPEEKVLDTVVTIVPDELEIGQQWTSYINFCRSIPRSDGENCHNDETYSSVSARDRNSYAL